MKTIIPVLFISALAALAQVNPIVRSPPMPSALDGLGDDEAQRYYYVTHTKYMDPLREIDGVTNLVTDHWMQFSGTVLQVHPGEGVRMDGTYFCPADTTGESRYTGEFFVSGFPYEVAENDEIGTGLQIFRAMKGDIYDYKTIGGSTRSLHQLVYGTPVKLPPPPPPTAEEIEAVRQRAEQKKTAALAAALKYNKDQADKGDAYGELRMGERYRDGDGVDKDLAKAKDYLQKSADQGDLTASNELANLPAK